MKTVARRRVPKMGSHFGVTADEPTPSTSREEMVSFAPDLGARPVAEPSPSGLESRDGLEED